MNKKIKVLFKGAIYDGEEKDLKDWKATRYENENEIIINKDNKTIAQIVRQAIEQKGAMWEQLTLHKIQILSFITLGIVGILVIFNWLNRSSIGSINGNISEIKSDNSKVIKMLSGDLQQLDEMQNTIDGIFNILKSNNE